MEGKDWFWLFLMFCLFSYLITYELGRLISKRNERLDAIEQGIEDIKSEIQLISEE
jgi:hypothetical protein